MALSPSEIQYQLDHINDDRGDDIIISHAVVLPLAVLAVFLRFISRYLCKARIGADDYMIIAALVGLTLPRRSQTRITRVKDDELTYFSAQLFAIGEAVGGFLCEVLSATA